MATKLLLVDDVFKLGRKGEIVSVKPGYARNFLIPQGKALIADKRTVRMQERLEEERQKQAVIDKKDSEEFAKKLEGVSIEIIVKVDPEGHMYGSVTVLDIVKHLEEQKGIVLDKHWVQLAHPIKEIGVSTVELKLKEDVPAEFKVKVVPEHSEHAQPIEPPKPAENAGE